MRIIRVYIDRCANIHMCILIEMCTCIHAHPHTCTHTHMHTPMHTPTHTPMHTHPCTPTHLPRLVASMWCTTPQQPPLATTTSSMISPMMTPCIDSQYGDSIPHTECLRFPWFPINPIAPLGCVGFWILGCGHHWGGEGVPLRRDVYVVGVGHVELVLHMTPQDGGAHIPPS